jgi:site-specific DNA recombinase
MTAKKTVRCAIYTRKSTDEGLEQEFSTLEAQREACEAYIKSQAHEGWRVIPERFDDGGHSGGTLERPAMQRLLERVRARRIDVILIYKIDRLTRSLADFAKLAEDFDKYGVSFVSITQQFNTTTSMGRLMLNVLLSFAQFEREIAGERIRDKIAASKKKGMWMGGTVPLGYDWKDRALVINQAEAKTVRALFGLYIKYGNVRTVVTQAARLGLKTKVRSASTGRRNGGNLLCRGHVYAMLGNPIYTGRIPHKRESYPATHAPIISEEVWQQVQHKLAENRKTRGKRPVTSEAAPNLLVGLLFDSNGNRFTPSHSVKNGRRYRYYIDQALTTGERPAKSKIRRIPANEIESAVVRGIADFLASPARLLESFGSALDASATKQTIGSGQRLSQELRNAAPAAWMPQIRPLLQRVTVGVGTIEIRVTVEAIRVALSVSEQTTSDKTKTRRGAHEYAIAIPARVGMRGGQMKLVLGVENRGNGKTDPALVKALAQAHDWFGQLLNGKSRSINEIAAAEEKASSYVGRVLRLAFLAPKIQEAIVEGNQAPELVAKRLILHETLPREWDGQLHSL